MRLSRLETAACAALLVAWIAACGRPVDENAGAARPEPLVEAVEARFGALPVEETLPGTVRARNQVAIRPEIAGRVVEVLARDGETARQGQPLVRLDGAEQRERLRQAEADVQLAEASAAAARARTAELAARVARTRALAAEKLVSVQEVESLEAQLAVLRASAEEAAARVEQARGAAEEERSALAKTVVRAPVAGRLGERRAEVGMLVDGGDDLFVIGDLDELIVEVNLTETMLADVAVGQPVAISTRGGGEAIAASLSRISPFLAEESFTALGEIDVDNRAGRLRPGMFVSVRILVGQSARAALVPVSAVWEEPATGELGVFVVEEAAGLAAMTRDGTDSHEQGRAVALRPVRVLAEGRGAAGVDGIEEGTWVVTVGQHLLAAELRVGRAGAGDEPPGGAPRAATRARVRPVSWERVAQLQELQNEDLLAGFLAKQRTLAGALGAEIPESEDEVDRVLEAAAAAEAGAPRGG